MSSRSYLSRFVAAAFVAVAFVRPAWAKPIAPEERAERMEERPARLRGIDVEEKLGASIPLDVQLTDETGKVVRLRDAFDGVHPVVLTLNYSDCPMLCSMQLGGFVDSLKSVDWTPGAEFRIITVGLNPKETPERAAATKKRYLAQYGRPEAAAGWHFLTGSEESVRAIAASVGFQYGYNEARDEWIHPAAIAILTPDGRVGRYLYGIQFHPKTVRLSLAEVSEGKIGSTVDRLVLYCFHYDEKEGRYAPVAMNIMRLGGGITALGLGAFLSLAWLRDAKKRKEDKKAPPVLSPAS